MDQYLDRYELSDCDYPSGLLWSPSPSTHHELVGSDASRLSPTAFPPSMAATAAPVVVVHDNLYYATCLAGGVLASSIRWLKTPLDCVKCNMQVHPTQYTGVTIGLRILWQQNGLAGLYRGLGPTILASSSHAGTKFCAYEFFKDRFSDLAGGAETHATTQYHRSAIYMASAACAEVCADVLTCPWEMLKIKVQTSPPGTFPTQLRPALLAMVRHRAETGFPFRSLGPLMGRQLPGTMVNFFVFEHAVQAMNTFVWNNDEPSSKELSSTTTTTQKLGTTFVAGYLAGFVMAVVSHPADSLFSLMGKTTYQGWSAWHIARHVGLVRLATQGLGPRVGMIGSIISFQWLIYDSFKMVMGLGTTGGRGTS